MSKMSKLFDQDNMFFAIMGVLFDLIVLPADRHGRRIVHCDAQCALAHGPP